MKVLNCNICLLDFFDYEGYEIRDKDIICSYCIDEESEEIEEREKDQKYEDE